LRLVKLRLNNFLSHRETEVEFPESGIILISGENAMGKSSLFDALRFALFGTAILDKSTNRREVLNTLVTKGQKNMSVEATFTHRGHIYTVLREYAYERGKPEPKSVALTKDGTLLLASGVTNLDQKLIQELGMNHEMFKYSVMAVQGNIMGVLSLNSSERKALFERMFGYHHLRLVAEASSSIVSERVKEREAILRTGGFSSLAELSKSVEEKLGKQAEYEALLSEVKLEREALSAEWERHEKEAQDIAEEERALAELEKEKASLESELSYLRSEIERLEKQIGDQRNRLNEIPRLRERLRGLEPALRDLAAMREEESLAEKCERAESLVKEIERKLEETRGYERVIRDLAPSHERFLALRAEEEKTLSALESIGTSIGESNQLSELLSKKRKEIESLERMLSEFQEIREPRSEILKLIKQKESEARRSEAELGRATERMERANKDISAIEKLGDTCPLCKQNLTPEHKAEVLSHLRTEHSRAKALSDELRRRSESLSKEIAELNARALRAEQKERLEELLARAMDEEKAAREKLAELSSAIKEHDALKRTLESLRSELKALEGAERDLAFAEDFVRKNPPAKLEQELLAAREELESAYEKRSFPDLSLEEIKRKIASFLPAEREFVKISAEIENLEKLAEEVKENEDRLREKRLRLAEVERRLAALSGIEERKSELERRKKAHSTTQKELQSKSDSLTQRETALRKDKEALEREIRSLSELKAETERIERRIDIFSRIKNRLLSSEGIEREFNAAMLRLEDNLKMYFQDFSFAGTYTVRLSDELRPVKVDEMGREMERLSGGEEVGMGIAMRFAIASTLLEAESESLFLDEPTHNLDSERISSLQNLLEEFKLRQIAPQIIIITHDDSMKSIADSVMEVVKRNGVSSVKKAIWV